MKRIVIGLLVCALCVGLAAAATVADFEKKESRIHQHLEAGEKAACSHGANLLCTHLPLVEIETGGHPIPGAPVLDEKGFIVDYTVTEAEAPRLKASLEITDNADTNNHVTDVPSMASTVLINIRGRSSREFDKKSYRITLIHDDGINNNQPVMGMDAHHEWVLHGPFLDKSLIRNYMWYNIAGECMEYAPNVRFCEVVIDGSYQGLYLMTESVTKGYDGSRLTMEVEKKGSTFSGYVLRVNDIYSFEETTSVINDYGNYAYVARIPVKVIFPGTVNQTEEMRRAIELEFSAFEKALYSYDYDSEDYGYTQWIDIHPFADYFILNEFTCNYDAGTLSTYIYGFGAYYQENIPDVDSPEFVEVNMILQLKEYYSMDDSTALGETFPTGQLRYGNANPESDDFDSLADYIHSGDYVEIKIPWQLLNFADPSKMAIHDDYYSGHYGINYIPIDTMYFGLSSASTGRRIHLCPVPVEGWGNKVTYHERLKPSYYILQSVWRDT